MEYIGEYNERDINELIKEVEDIESWEAMSDDEWESLDMEEDFDLELI